LGLLIHHVPRRQIIGQYAPGSARPNSISQRIEYLAQPMLRRQLDNYEKRLDQKCKGILLRWKIRFAYPFFALTATVETMRGKLTWNLDSLMIGETQALKGVSN
jgi:hypothetical protein